ncbi:MAG: homocysteine S-methyltransferase family protein, partial [Chloroflexota bacterium]
MKPFLERLKENRPLLADGAMGTLLHARGIPMNDCFERCNLTRPELVSEIYRAYIAAGSDMIEANTFGANRLKLADFGLEDQVEAINRAGVELALKAVKESGREVYVVASIGPLGIGVQPYGRLKQEDARAIYAEQILTLVQAGANGLLFETFTDLTEALLALEVAKQVAPELPVISEMTFGHEDRTLTGHLPGNVARKLHEAGADVVGVNCSAGPGHISRILQMMKQAAP